MAQSGHKISYGYAFKICFDQIFVVGIFWEVSTGDAVMTMLLFQSLCHTFSHVAALMM